MQRPFFFGFTRSAPFLLFRIVLVAVLGGLFALVKLLVLIIVLSPIIASLVAVTYGAHELQQNYPTLIQQFFNSPEAESEFITLANAAIQTYNFIIQLLAYLVDIWDYLVPSFYLLWNLIEQIADQLLTVIFGTPKIQCIIADLLKVAVEVLEHGAIDVNRIFHTVTQFMQSEESARLFSAFAASMGTCDPNDPEQVFGCPRQGTILQLFVVVLKLAMDLATIAIQFLTPFVISFVRTVLTQLLQWFPAVVKILSAIFSSLLNSGAISIILNIVQNTLNIAEVLFNLFCPLFAISSSAVCEVIVVIEATILAVIDGIESVICGLEGWFAPAPNIRTSDIQEQENITRQLEKIYSPYLYNLTGTEKVLTYQQLLTGVLGLSAAQVNALSRDLSQDARELDLVSNSYDQFLASTSVQLANALGENPDDLLESFLKDVISRDTFSGFTDKLADFRAAEINSQLRLFSNVESIDAFMSINDRSVTLTTVDQLIKPLNNVPTADSGLLGKSSFCKSKTGSSTLKAFGTNSKACADILNSTCAGVNFGKDIENFIDDIVKNTEDAANLTLVIFKLIPNLITNITTLFEETVQVEASLISGIVQDITGSVEFIVNTGLLNNSIQELVNDLDFSTYDSLTAPNTNPTQQGFSLNSYTCCSFPSDNSSTCCDGTPGFPSSDNGGAFDLCTLRSSQSAPTSMASEQLSRTFELLEDNQQRIRAAHTAFTQKSFVEDTMFKAGLLFEAARPFFNVDDEFFSPSSGIGDDDPNCKATPEDPYKCCTGNSTSYHCCRGLVGCIPPIPVDRLVINITITNATVQWIKQLEDRETCAPLDNGFEQILFLIRLVTNQPISDLIARVPVGIRPIYDFLFGWLTFRDGFPSYAWACLVLNIYGLLIIFTVLFALFLLQTAFGPWLAKLYAISEDYYLQREISADNQDSYASQYLPSGAPVVSNEFGAMAVIIANLERYGDEYQPTQADIATLRRSLKRITRTNQPTPTNTLPSSLRQRRRGTKHKNA